MNTIGQMIGKITHYMSVTNDQDDEVKIKQVLDCTTASDDQIRSYIAADRTIARARPLRKLTAEEIRALDGKTYKIEYAGHKIVSREEQVKQFEAAGIPRALAEVAVDNPDMFKAVMEKTANDVESDKS